MNERAEVSFKPGWGISLAWTNVAIVVIDVIAIALDPARTLHSMVQMLAFTFVFANVVSVLAMLAMGWLITRPKISRLPKLAVILPGIVVITVIGCMLAQALLIAVRGESASEFWLACFHALRIALPLALVFCLGAMTHASLLGRVQAMEQALHEKEIAEER